MRPHFFVFHLARWKRTLVGQRNSMLTEVRRWLAQRRRAPFHFPAFASFKSLTLGAATFHISQQISDSTASEQARVGATGGGGLTTAAEDSEEGESEHDVENDKAELSLEKVEIGYAQSCAGLSLPPMRLGLALLAVALGPLPAEVTYFYDAQQQTFPSGLYRIL